MELFMNFLEKIAEGCLPFLHFLQGLRNPVTDWFFETVTHLGEELPFLVLAVLFFWCINKREGYYILICGLIGTLCNQVAKLACRIPRPWVLDPTLEVVGDAKIEATGYSFPSGHTQNIASTFGSIAAYNRKSRWVTVVCVIIIVLVAFSRMYLGVHTPLDVVVSLLFALLLVLGLRPVFSSDESFSRYMPFVVGGSVVLSVAFLIYAALSGGDSTLDPANYESALKNACTLVGCTAGLILVYTVDEKYIRFETNAVWYAQVIKAVLGFAGLLLIKEGLRAPLEFICFGNIWVARAIRYFTVVAFAGAVWPLTFKWFSKLRIGFMDRFTEKLTSIFKKQSAD